jgi:general secretion pathway protein D/MSHA biogenesis protein MshL
MKIEQLAKPKKMLGKKSMLAKKRLLLGGVTISAMLILIGCATPSKPLFSGFKQSSEMESSAASDIAVAGESRESVPATDMSVAGAPRESAIQPVQPDIAPAAVEEAAVGRALPVRFQKPSYLIKDTGMADDAGEVDDELSLRVGADITTTEGAVPLRDIMKRLASLHNMNVSWASDVDQYVYIDVDIRAEDDFFNALDNMLRQVDYFYELKGNTIIIKFKETRKYHVALPPRIKGQASINTKGGSTTNTEEDNTRWTSIENSLSQILDIWAQRYEAPPSAKPSDDDEDAPAAPQKATRIKTTSGFFSVDQSLGLITVTAPRPLLDKVQIYVDTLKEEMYKQINIEAKILEVTLDESSDKGIDWENLLGSSPFNFTATFGTAGQIYPDSGGVIDTITLASKGFNLILDALNKVGTTKVLSNPRISVMNGQPAVIYVGDNVTYISEVETTIDEGTVTTSVTTAQAVSGLRLEVYATIMSNDEIVMSIIPMISQLEEPIQYESFGDNIIGLPFIRERTMNSIVRLNNGEMLIVGGLINSQDVDTSSKVAGLGSLPGMKFIFGNKKQSTVRKELVILIRPRIL